MLNAAVIGSGIMGKLHLRVYSKLPNVNLVAVADTNDENRNLAMNKYNINGYKDYKEMLEKEKLDIVSIAAPTHLHKQIACDVLNKKINALVEKPLALTYDDGKAVIEAAKKNNVKLMVGHIERFNPAVEIVKRNIADSKIVSMNITRVGPFPPRMNNVGVIKDIGVHDIDLIRYLTNSEVDKIFACSSKNIGQTEDTAILTFKMQNGVLANIITNWLTPYKVREIEIAGTEKFIKANLITQQVSEYSAYHFEKTNARGYATNELFVPFGEAIVRELEHFVECVEQNKEPLVTGEDGLKAIEIAQKCVEFADKL
jgi:predicted dehydrogenase